MVLACGTVDFRKGIDGLAAFYSAGNVYIMVIMGRFLMKFLFFSSNITSSEYYSGFKDIRYETNISGVHPEVAIIVFILKLKGFIEVKDWTVLFIFSLSSFGIAMLTLSVLGGYLWRTSDASRKRPPDIVEDENEIM